MKKMKKMMCLLLAAVMVLSAGFAVNGTEAEAADANTLKAPKAVRCGVGASNGRYVEIPLTSKTGDIKDIKVYKGKKKTSNLVVKKAYVYRDETEPTAELRIYAKKAGKYTVKYNVYADGKKTGKTRKFTVNAKGYGSVLSSVTINKKNVTKYVANYEPTSYYTTKDKIKVKFKAAAGCKVKKIEMVYRDKNGKEVVKKIKNGKKVKLGQYAGYRSTSYSWSKDMWAVTTFRITYVDKYSQYDTKAERTTSFNVYKRAKKWYDSSKVVYDDED